MPVLKSDNIAVDYSDDGSGPPVILVHGGGGGNRQWRRLIDDLKNRYRLLAINLRGIGDSSPLSPGETQSLDDQAILVHTLAESIDGPISLVGHSFGGNIAMKAALSIETRVKKLILIDPNPFHLLGQQHKDEANAEITAVRDHFVDHFEQKNWDAAGLVFVDYWFGSGTWAGMDEKQHMGWQRNLPTIHDAWPALFNETTPIEAWGNLAGRMVIITAVDTPLSIKAIRDVLLENLPGVRQAEIPEGGHMAAVFRPDLVNPLIAGFLDD